MQVNGQWTLLEEVRSRDEDYDLYEYNTVMVVNGYARKIWWNKHNGVYKNLTSFDLYEKNLYKLNDDYKFIEQNEDFGWILKQGNRVKVQQYPSPFHPPPNG